MSASTFTLIGLGLCVMIVLTLCIIAVRRFESLNLSEEQTDEGEEVLELRQLSFDQVTEADGAETAEIEPLESKGEAAGASPHRQEKPATPALANVEFGVRPETLIIEGMRPRLEYSMALLNQTETTLVSIRITSDLVIFDPDQKQAVRPCAPNLRQDSLARLAPGERIIIQGDWAQPEGLPERIDKEAGKGAYLLARARIVGANVAPKSQYFLIGHLLPNNKLMPIRNSPETFSKLGVTEAQAQVDDSGNDVGNDGDTQKD